MMYVYTYVASLETGPYHGNIVTMAFSYAPHTYMYGSNGRYNDEVFYTVHQFQVSHLRNSNTKTMHVRHIKQTQLQPSESYFTKNDVVFKQKTLSLALATIIMAGEHMFACTYLHTKQAYVCTCTYYNMTYVEPCNNWPRYTYMYARIYV